MKNKFKRIVANALLKVGKHYNMNVSPKGYYKPKKAKEENI